MFINTGTQSGVGASQQSASAGPHMRAPQGGDRTANTGLGDPVPSPDSFENVAESIVYAAAPGAEGGAVDSPPVPHGDFESAMPGIPGPVPPLSDEDSDETAPSDPLGDATIDLPRAAEPSPGPETQFMPSITFNVADMLAGRFWPQSR